jgi:hypothetical protein
VVTTGCGVHQKNKEKHKIIVNREKEETNTNSEHSFFSGTEGSKRTERGRVNTRRTAPYDINMINRKYRGEGKCLHKFMNVRCDKAIGQ